MSSSSPSASRPRRRRPRTTLLQARDRRTSANFHVFSNHVTIVPPIKAILESPDLRLDGFLGPGPTCRPSSATARTASFRRKTASRS